MGMDSVEIISCWEESLQIEVPDEDASSIKNPHESIELLVGLVGACSASGPSLILRSFNKVRNILISEFAIDRSRITPKSKLSSLFPRKNRRLCWNAFISSLETGRLSSSIGWPLFGFGGIAIDDIVIELVAKKANLVKSSSEAWHRNQIREVVRCSITLVVGIRNFIDLANYVEDIGID